MRNNNTKIHLKKGDKVQVITGAEKGKEGEIIKIYPKKCRALVKEVNLVKKHLKPTQDTQGGIVDKEASIHLSNLMLLDPKSGQPSRVGRKMVDGKLKRYSKKSGEIID